MRVLVLPVGVAALPVAAAAVPARAQTKQQIDWCVNEDNAFSPDLRINGRTAAIQSGKWSGKGLAWAFNNRGNTRHAVGDNDRAIADYNQALRLDPKLAAAFNGRGNAYQAKGNYEYAVADCTAAIQIEPSADSFN